MRTLYGVNLSPFVRKTRVFLAEKGLEYKLEPVNPFTAGPEYKHISPLGKVPAFQDDQVTIADSSVICSYLERTNPTPALYPKDAVGNAKSLWFEEYGDSGLGPVLSGTVFRQKVVMPLLFKQPTDEEAVNKALNENIPPLFDYLESQLPASSAALVGGHFSVGDIGVATHFVNFRHAGESVDAQRWPKLAKYIDTMHARPSFTALIEEESAVLKGA